jgi:hypothetical protein
MGYGNDSRQSGPLETLPIDLLYAHLDVSFIFNHLDAINGGPNFSSVTPPREKKGELGQNLTFRQMDML